VLGDPRVPWVVLLHAVLAESPPSRDVVQERLVHMAVEAGWQVPSAVAVSPGARTLLGELCSASPEALRLGSYDRGLILAARHDALDGLAMLTALGHVLGKDVRSSVRGVEAAGRTSPTVRTILSRAWEVGVRPQAGVVGSNPSATPGDSYAARTIDGAPRTADLVYAGALAVATWNRSHGARPRPVSVAVGVSTVGGRDAGLADHSAFLRLRAVERMSLGGVREQLVHAPLQLGGFVPAPPRGLAAATRMLFRAAAPRLGSTLLVSHLGTVLAPDEVEALEFFPVTGGGSGLSLGAATVRGRTTLTLRARGTQHDDEGLQGLLALVVEELGRSGQGA
jgi:hypothetical protein